MAISPERPDNTLTMAEKHAIPIDILSDATSEVLKKYRLWFAVPGEVKTLYLEKFGLNLEKHNGAGRWELPVPATYVLDRDGIVRAGEADPDYTVRMEPAEIVAGDPEVAGEWGTRPEISERDVRISSVARPTYKMGARNVPMRR